MSEENDDYLKLLDRAFERMPHLSAESIDFKIPDVESIIQGTKTIIRNIGVIADRARRTPQEIGKFLSKELAVPTSFEDQRLIINGKFQNDELNKRMHTYFETYVICRECHKPDTHLESGGRGMLQLVCEACGARYGVKSY
ncbi:MAG: translation initiation factor IF-2 subunit beta [Candidatus Marsarchaeota archaeon]|nr:translation initiation factor IF-2 subunit beta [Candidatus Marsarchaeota archaeon]MCL5112663.1 translation initiation factor IF-2 subunit beta [Candidatus Marsarchaeota archaeon]